MANIASVIFNIIFTSALVYFAWRQHQLGKINQKIALYDKRWMIYTEIIRFIDFCIKTKDSTEPFPMEEAQRFLDNTRPAAFLFQQDEELMKYIQTLWEKATLIRKGNVRRENQSLNIIDDEDIKLWFANQIYTLDEKFEPYLRIKE